MKNRIFVGLGEYVISKNETDELVTMALGSCVAVILASKKGGTAAMIHAVVPTCHSAKVDSKKNGYYVDFGLSEMIELYLKKTHESTENLLCWVVGGAVSKQSPDPFEIGLKNVERVKIILKTYGIKNYALEVGGHVSRSVYFDVGSKELSIHQQDMIL